VVPSAHYAIAVTTLAETSSLQHFLINLHAMIFVAILVATSLIRLMMILRDSLSMPYFFFIYLANAFSFVLSSRNCVGSSTHDGKHVMYEMSSTSIETSCSSHKHLPCVTAISFLMQLFAYCLLVSYNDRRPDRPYMIGGCHNEVHGSLVLLSI
jgi:hypothetical protein